MPSAYVALLRGVNVGGHRRVPMADLRGLCEGLGFGQVATYIQSGNIVFTSDHAVEEVGRRLEAAIAERFAFAVAVVVRSRAQLAAVAESHPFAGRQTDRAKLHVVFFEKPPPPEAVAALMAGDTSSDEVTVQGREAFVHHPSGAGRSKLNLDLLGEGTARNWRSVTKLLELLEGLDVPGKEEAGE